LYSIDDLDRALSGVDLAATRIVLDAGAAFLAAAPLLAALWDRRKVARHKASAAFQADPLTALASEGTLPYDTATGLRWLGQLARWTAQSFPDVTAVGVNTSRYHDAGATATLEIALSIATGVEYLRVMTACGLDVDRAARQIQFTFCLDAQCFHSIAKLRAARRLWARVVQVSGGSDSAAAMRIHAQMGRRMLTQRGADVNLMRNTAGVFAACVGGAQSIGSLPFDAAIGPANEFSRRIARNTLLILQEEAQLHRVVDPAGGSWFVDRLTEQMADNAWSAFQQIERQGGLRQSLASGWVHDQINAVASARIQGIARRTQGMVGINEFANVDERPAVRAQPDLDQLRRAASARVAASRPTLQALTVMRAESIEAAIEAAIQAAGLGASIGQLSVQYVAWQGDSRESPSAPSRPSEMPALELCRLAAPFESLRDASDAWLAEHGRRPAVFLLYIGDPSDCRAKAAYAESLFASGGLAVVPSSAIAGTDTDAAVTAFLASSCRVVVLCSSDTQSAMLVPQLAEQLKEAGARLVMLVGGPFEDQERWRAAGVDHFLHSDCDALAILRDVMCRAGVGP
jgi:methylmalonyl-CoA mutase